MKEIAKPHQTTGEQLLSITETDYLTIGFYCKELFLLKAQDYGTSWAIMRPSSITDQLFIKAKRIRTLEETKDNRVGDSIESEYIALVNYSIIAMVLCDFIAQNKLPESHAFSLEELTFLYEDYFNFAYITMQAKNHDYGEAWRDMRITSLTDLILSKILRIKQIEDNHGSTFVSEGVSNNYLDIINYSLFALIKMGYAQKLGK